MLSKLLFQHTLGAFLVLALSCILLSTYNILSQPQYGSLQGLDSRHTPTQAYLSKDIQNIALPFGEKNYSPNFSTSFVRLLHTKRAVLTYEEARCNGERLYNMIKQVYQGTRRSGTSYTQANLDNGWSRITEHQELDPEWDGWFDETLDRVPGRNEVVKIAMSQDKPFNNKNGVQKGPTGGYYQCYFIRSAAAIIATDIKSPKYLLEMQQKSAQEIPNLIPPLTVFSDVMWTVWKLLLEKNSPDDGHADDDPENHTKEPTDPSRLRYIGHDFINNENNVAVMEHIYEQTKADAEAQGKPEPNTEYPGLSFDLESPNGLALLGTPNGVGTGWVLMDQFRYLGPRKVTVTIFTGDDDAYMNMVWHLGDP
ncbi:MAG: hypothetical protein Q9179_001364 [Wetmoreana sp. 5 TL-2023]